jgi:hypothetical protein
MRGEGRIDQTLALEQVVRRHEDAHDEVETEDRLAEGSPDRCVDDLGTFATQARPGTRRRLVSQSIERTLRRRLVELRADVGLQIAEGVGLVKPAQDELGRGERGLDLGQPNIDAHFGSFGKASSDGSPFRNTASMRSGLSWFSTEALRGG